MSPLISSLCISIHWSSHSGRMFLPITLSSWVYERKNITFACSYVHYFRLCILMITFSWFRNSQTMEHFNSPTTKYGTLSKHLLAPSTLKCSYNWFRLDPEKLWICLSHAFVLHTWVQSYQIFRLKSYSVPKYDLVRSVSSLNFYCNQMILLIRNCSRSASNGYFD